jgi:hypothetical protein
MSCCACPSEAKRRPQANRPAAAAAGGGGGSLKATAAANNPSAATAAKQAPSAVVAEPAAVVVSIPEAEKAVTTFLGGIGQEDQAEGAIAAFKEAGTPPVEWVSYLQDMDADAEGGVSCLDQFLESVKEQLESAEEAGDSVSELPASPRTTADAGPDAEERAAIAARRCDGGGAIVVVIVVCTFARGEDPTVGPRQSLP